MDLEDDDPTRFETVLAGCGQDGRRGVNVTFPYKERAAATVPVDDAAVRRIGAVNTVLFREGVAVAGHNTDHSGFIAAYRGRYGGAAPGRVAVIGAGGVGRPVIAGLQSLGAKNINVFDIDKKRARRLAADLGEGAAPIRVCTCPEEALDGADGIVNATPVGMYRFPGLPMPQDAIGRPAWAFDVIYTPLETEFLALAAAAGAEVMGGYELFIHQGIDAFRHFTGREVDEQALRSALAAEA